MNDEDSYITRDDGLDPYYKSEATNLFPYDADTDVLLNDEQLQRTHAVIGIRCLHTLLNLQAIDQGRQITEWTPFTLKENRENRAIATARVEALAAALNESCKPPLTFEEKLAEIRKEYAELRAPWEAVLAAEKKAR